MANVEIILRLHRIGIAAVWFRHATCDSFRKSGILKKDSGFTANSTRVQIDSQEFVNLICGPLRFSTYLRSRILLRQRQGALPSRWIRYTF
jgi:hypothetical protein